MGLLTEFGPNDTFEYLAHYLNNRGLRVTVRPPTGQGKEWIVVLGHAGRHDSDGYIGRGGQMWIALTNAAAEYDRRHKEVRQ